MVAMASLAVLVASHFVIAGAFVNSTTKRNLLLMFDRPNEPLFLPRHIVGSDKRVIFEAPAEFADERYRPVYSDLKNRFGSNQDDERVSIQGFQQLPDISEFRQLGRKAIFSTFVPHHRKLASVLLNKFMSARDVDTFFSTAAYVRDHVNPQLFNYAYSVALLHRPDTRNVDFPPLHEVFPNKFVGSDIFPSALQESTIIQEGQRNPIEIPKDYTATDLDVEHKLAYFREDMGINLHHWHWHLVYPFDGTVDIVRKDRRGELFYYMHEQVMARYNAERLCNNMERVRKFNNFRERIREGYFPKLDGNLGSRNWPPRFSDVNVKDVNRETDQVRFEISDLERWRDRLYAAIHAGVVQDDQGRTIPLNDTLGIDILGNLVEPSILSANRNLYGSLHNFGHLALGFCHDPDGRHLENMGVIGDSATAMRDPVFYRWHAFIGELFQEHKNTLPRYSQSQLVFPGVRVRRVEVISQGQVSRPNQFHTFWQQSVVDMQRGLDFYPTGAVLVKFTHLQHVPFEIKITVENSGEPRMGTARVFLGPKFDERGAPLLFKDHRTLFIELDKFFVYLKRGTQTYDRKSVQSSVTIPFERTFRNLGLNARPDEGSTQLDSFNFCGCGWPQHMMIPKGREGNGMPMQLFVMISNYADDRVDLPRNQPNCSDAASYCGIRDSLYPDRRSMGFPFDRPARDNVGRLEEFLTPNMAVVDVSIIHSNRTVDQTGMQLQGLQTRLGGQRPASQTSSSTPSRNQNSPQTRVRG